MKKKENMPFVNVLIKNSNNISQSDIDGNVPSCKSNYFLIRQLIHSAFHLRFCQSYICI